MKKYLGICILFLFSVGVAGDVCTIRGVNGPVQINCTGSAFGQTPITLAQLTAKTEPVHKVDDVIAGMKKLGFNEIYSIPFGDEMVITDERSVDGYSYRALVYKGKGCFEPKIARSSLTKADGSPAGRLEELKLMLTGKIPYAVYNGVWFPSRMQGPAEELSYGAQAEVTTLETLADGRVVRLVRIPGSVPFFSVELTKKVMKKDMATKQVITDESTENSSKQVYRIPTEKELRDKGIIQPDEKIVQMLAVDTISMMNRAYVTRTMAVQQEREVTQTLSAIYPFIE